jgi:hypothetical protein
MPNYTPIELPALIHSSQSDVLNFHWDKNRGITADFLIPDDDGQVLRLSFSRVEVVRLLDEMPISTESDTRNVGLVPNHLAYEVTGSTFWAQQSDALKHSLPAMRHYRFITGWTCIDVLSLAKPVFAVVTKAAA